ncbi:hypothetical protein TWF730_004747 [Orbilia blumenaviensis]|uniref:DASH complex subunit DAD2 n=1 Tax=Orbilia blumenaviensis TaxID=1796055 RepID=A0AAV9TWY9_9PEZI
MSSEADLQSELDSLRVLRATLESVKHFVDAIENDAKAMGENAKTVTDLSRQWGEAIQEAAVAVGEIKPKPSSAQK